jgi:hypothetical protein
MPYKNSEKKKEYQKKYREKNKEKAKEYNTKYYCENKEKLKEQRKEYMVQYYKDHKDEFIARATERQQSDEWKSYAKNYHEENRDKILKQQRNKWKTDPEFRKKSAERLKEVRLERSTWLKEFKSDKQCKFCEESDSFCLDFHHRDPDDKKRNISEMINSAFSLKTILKEIDKCDILCSNCHRKFHAGTLDV